MTSLQQKWSTRVQALDAYNKLGGGSQKKMKKPDGLSKNAEKVLTQIATIAVEEAKGDEAK